MIIMSQEPYRTVKGAVNRYQVNLRLLTPFPRLAMFAVGSLRNPPI